jgi:hypothetical protein
VVRGAPRVPPPPRAKYRACRIVRPPFAFMDVEAAPFFVTRFALTHGDERADGGSSNLGWPHALDQCPIAFPRYLGMSRSSSAGRSHTAQVACIAPWSTRPSKALARAYV